MLLLGFQRLGVKGNPLALCQGLHRIHQLRLTKTAANVVPALFAGDFLSFFHLFSFNDEPEFVGIGHGFSLGWESGVRSQEEAQTTRKPMTLTWLPRANLLRLAERQYLGT